LSLLGDYNNIFIKKIYFFSKIFIVKVYFVKKIYFIKSNRRQKTINLELARTSSYEPAWAGSIGSLLNTRAQSELMMRDAAVFVSLLSIPNIGWLEPGP
jgi:hypothetical protein